MNTRMLVAFCGGLLTVSPAVAQEVSAPVSPPVPEKKICRTITPIGSIMGKRFCLTKAEWQKLDAINADNAETGLAGRRLRNQKNSDF
jgi:hypothetical protein